MFTCLLFYFHSSQVADRKTLSFGSARFLLVGARTVSEWEMRATRYVWCSQIASMRSAVCPVYAYAWLLNIHVLMSFELSDRWKHVVYTIRSAYLVHSVCACSFRRMYATRSWSSIHFTEFTVWFPFRINFYSPALSLHRAALVLHRVSLTREKKKSKQTFACFKFLYLININDFDLMKLIFSWVCLPFVFVSFSEYHGKYKQKRPIIYF